MTSLPSEPLTWIELHDSTLDALQGGEPNLLVSLGAYVHRWEQVDDVWRGTGWSQSVQMRITEAHLAVPPDAQGMIWDGFLRIDGYLYENLLPLPHRAMGAVCLQLTLNSGTVLEFSGKAVEIVSTGEAVFIEVLPDDLRPEDAAYSSYK